MTELSTREEWTSVLDSVDTVLFDCDGVLWTGSNQVIQGAQEVVKFLRSKGKSVYFVSNNSSKSRAEYLQKFDKLDFEAYEEEIFCTSYVTAYYVKHTLRYQGKVYLVGMEGFGSELELMGMTYVGPGPDHIQGESPDWARTPLDPDVKAVVVGYDRHFSFSKAIKACSYAKNPDNLFIGTNMDASLPLENKEIVIPGTGCQVSYVSHGAERKPLLIGKPNLPMFQVIQSKAKLDPSKTLMIGDRLSTDIQFGLRHGMKTLLVFTGSVSRQDLSSVAQEAMPHYMADSVAGFLTCLS